MKISKTVLFVFIVLMANVVQAAVPIKDLIDYPIGAKLDGSSPSLNEVQRAIISGCRARGWTPVVDGDSRITASILVRGKHFAEVEILYTEKAYSIIYKSSRGLKYDEGYQWIHRNYNKWVFNLSDSIQRQFGDATEP